VQKKLSFLPRKQPRTMA